MQVESYPAGENPIQRAAPASLPELAELAPAHFDLVVLGGGSGAEELCETLAEAGGEGKVALSVAVVEADRVGGKCPFLACMPSKAMLRSASVRRLALGASRFGSEEAGAHSPEAAWREAVSRRDSVAEQRDDRYHLRALESIGVEVVRGRGRVTGWGRLAVEGSSPRLLSFETLVLATGSRPSLPPVEGLEQAALWTSEDALSSAELPSSLAILGGGPVGCELAEIYAGYLPAGRITLLESADRLLSSEEEAIGLALADHLRRRGVEVAVGARLERAEQVGAHTLCHLASGEVLTVARFVVAAGRSPNTGGIGLEQLGVELGAGGEVMVGEDLLAARDPESGRRLFAIGDVNGIAPFTHAAKHQARQLAATLLGEGAPTRGLFPRCVYTDPPLAAVGLTVAEARERGIEVETAGMDLAGTARAEAEGRLAGDGLSPESGGLVLLVADKERGVLLGASAFGPRADEWIGQLTLAVRAELPLALLSDVVQPFPTYCEALTPLFRQLARACGRRKAPGSQ